MVEVQGVVEFANTTVDDAMLADGEDETEEAKAEDEEEE